MWKVGQGPTAEHSASDHSGVTVDRTDNGRRQRHGSARTRRHPSIWSLTDSSACRASSSALGGDAWGFKMEDRDWAQELQDRRPRGPTGQVPALVQGESVLRPEDSWPNTQPAGAYVGGRFPQRVAVGDYRSHRRANQVGETGAPMKSPFSVRFAEKNKGRFIRLQSAVGRRNAQPQYEGGKVPGDSQRTVCRRRCAKSTKSRSCWCRWANS